MSYITILRMEIQDGNEFRLIDGWKRRENGRRRKCWKCQVGMERMSEEGIPAQSRGRQAGDRGL